MKLTRLRGSCSPNEVCPTLYATDRGTFIVQGFVVDDPEALTALDLPPGESAVEIPLSLLPEVAPDARR
ncbi:MAG: hypothetical protein ACRDT6_07085 [Micromonosporaceae bacterium]